MKRVKIFCRSFDLRLYRLSKALYEDMGYECVRLTDQSADGYFHTMLEDTECDIAVNIDEDAFITDISSVNRLIETAVSEGYANIGYSDGDVATTHRNPIVTNPFFNIFNLELIRSKYDRKRIRPVNYTDKEPYYPFFFWLAEEFKTLYLPCKRHDDGITTIGYDTDGKAFCLHTWYSRFYSMPSVLVRLADPKMSRQKTRINGIIQEAYRISEREVPVFNIIDRVSFLSDKTERWVVKIPQRVSRWPFKIRKKFFLSKHSRNISSSHS